MRQLRETCESCSWKDCSNLEIVLTQSISFAELRKLEAAEVLASIATDAVAQRAFDEGRDGDVPPGGVINLRVPRHIGRLAVVEDLPDLLTVPGAQAQEPSAYLLVASRSKAKPFCHLKGEELDDAPETVRQYHEAIRLWSILEQQADHTDGNGVLLFFGMRLTQIAPGFELGDFPKEGVITDIAAFIGNLDRKDARKEIFVSALSDFLRDQSEAKAFAFLLRDVARFERRLKEGLAIYLADNSPTKLADEAKSAALSISEKLEKTINGLETKSLSVPAALLLAVKDIETGSGLTVVNLIIFAATLTYGLTMTFVHQSQTSLLRVIRDTISSTVSEFKKKGLDQQNPIIATTYESLKQRCIAAFRGSIAMVICSWAPLVSVVFAIFLGTPKPSTTITIPALKTAPVTLSARILPTTPSPEPMIKFSIPLRLQYEADGTPQSSSPALQSAHP